MLIRSDQQSASEFVRGAIGYGVVSSQATAAGAASLPAPATQTNFGWFVNDGFVNNFIFTTGVAFIEPAGTRVNIDSKSARKVGQDEDIVIMLDNLGSQGLDVTLAGRMLVKLH